MFGFPQGIVSMLLSYNLLDFNTLAQKYDNFLRFQNFWLFFHIMRHIVTRNSTLNFLLNNLSILRDTTFFSCFPTQY